MKIITLNTHSLIEPGYVQKREAFLQVLLREQPDILAMQEVNQTVQAEVLSREMLGGSGYVPCPGAERPVREDNHAAWLAQRLAECGTVYSWSWLPAKLGYGKYDEGVALFSRSPVREAEGLCISRTDDYQNWKTRKVLGIRTEQPLGWFYTVHMGWWEDEEEPYRSQWQVLNAHLGEKKSAGCPAWVMGDFNSPSAVRGQGYDLVCESGWYDTYTLAREKDDGITVAGEIDGWRGQPGTKSGKSGNEEKKKTDEGMRIDHIFCSLPISVLRSRVICSGKREPQVSDHYGVMIEAE